MALQLSKLVPYAASGWLPGGRRNCIMCGHTVWRFMPYRRGSSSGVPLMIALDAIGSDIRNFECPRCGAHDRERHLLLYLQASALLSKMSGKAILHFAPEKHLSKLFVEVSGKLYVPCDLYPQNEDVMRVDMQDIEFPSESFDFVIANHVLEHVENIEKSLGELFRVLKTGGYAILQTPYSAKLKRTWSDPGIDTSAARLQAYGQEDHMRLFGSDIFELIQSVGFKSLVQSHDEILATVDSRKMGVNPREPFFLFAKP